jgi:hypothetical protein
VPVIDFVFLFNQGRALNSLQQQMTARTFLQDKPEWQK